MEKVVNSSNFTKKVVQISKQTRKPPGYWRNKENIDKFFGVLKQKYNLNTPQDWNSITHREIRSNGGNILLTKHSIYELKCMACPEGKSIFNNPVGFWENKENVLNFLSKIKEKYNLNTSKDWNSITQKHIRSNGGTTLLNKFSMDEIKYMACPEGELIFNDFDDYLGNKEKYQAPGYWENKENIHNFLNELKQKYKLNTPEDWNLITQKHIRSYGGGTLLTKYSIYDLKCMACPEGKSIFDNPRQTAGYWENKENIGKFLNELKQKYNLNTPEDWNSLPVTAIRSNGGSRLFSKYSMFDLKCMACPEGKSIFNNPKQPSAYWENKENIDKFLNELKQKYNLNTPEDWKRISKNQITSLGGWGFYNCKNFLKINIAFESPNETTKFIPLSKLISKFAHKRSSQRWLFLQVQKLFPQEEIVEDYFHSEISRLSGCNVQFDIFMIERNIAIEYHGKHHYEDIPTAGFSSLETYKHRDLEKEKLCEEYGIQLIVIPYWWNNKLDSLKTFLYSKINKTT